MTERTELENELMRLATAPTVAPTGVYTNACYDAAKEIAVLRRNLEDAEIELRNLGNMGIRAAQPRLFSGCLRDGVCRGVCRNKDCPNYDLVVAARLVVEPQEADVLYPKVMT